MSTLATYFAKTNKAAIHIVDTRYAVLGKAVCGASVQHNSRPSRTDLTASTCKKCRAAASVDTPAAS